MCPWAVGRLACRQLRSSQEQEHEPDGDLYEGQGAANSRCHRDVDVVRTGRRVHAPAVEEVQHAEGNTDEANDDLHEITVRRGWCLRVG